ncbi:MAG: DUF3048 domain-containing protein [Leptolinea sp.]|nr:DUF3048 domain-containing protein [Leptolinea sp.]
MKPETKKIIQILLPLIVLTGGVVLLLQHLPSTAPAPTPSSTPTLTATPKSLPTGTPTTKPSPTATAEPSVMPTAVPEVPAVAYPVGPENYPPGINPLNGLMVEDTESLKLPPALLSISNSPVTARPQAGLSWAPLIYEMFIGAGNSRFLTIFYGDLPKTPDTDNPEIGPIRSGRLAYEHVRKLLNGFIVMAYASDWVFPSLNYFHNLQTEHPDDINGGRLRVFDLIDLKRSYLQELGEPNPIGLVFDPTVPAGGKDGQTVWLPYAYVDQIWWHYDEDSGTYHRWQDRENGKDYTEQVDSLTDEPLEIENVVVIFVDHIAYRETLIDLTLLYTNRERALLFRDGQVFEGYWTTKGEEYEKTTGRLRPLRFLDKNGDPFPLKPGQTWVEIVTQETPVYETEYTEDYYRLVNNKQPGSGIWVVRFVHPENIQPNQ